MTYNFAENIVERLENLEETMIEITNVTLNENSVATLQDINEKFNKLDEEIQSVEAALDLLKCKINLKIMRIADELTPILKNHAEVLRALLDRKHKLI